MGFEVNENFYKRLSDLFAEMNIEPLIIIGKDRGNGTPQLNIVGPYPLEMYRGYLFGALQQMDLTIHRPSGPGIILPFKK